jgi:hypothetical protein
VAETFARGGATFFNGPLYLVLEDKRNLALLSANQDAECFDEAERQLVRSLVPWTRQVARERTLFRGEPVFLPELLPSRREHLVLKRATEYAGEEVFLGRVTPAAAWEDLVRQALESGDWVVQELVESKPYLYQTGVEGCAPHDVIWGLFVFGSRYAGVFLRMQPKDRAAIVNSRQGATQGIVFEVEDSP